MITAEYLLSYILPLFAFDFTKWDEVVKFLIFFLTFSYLCIRHGHPKNKEQLVEAFNNWSEDKANRFSNEYIVECIDYLEKTLIISLDICGNYELTKNYL